MIPENVIKEIEEFDWKVIMTAGKNLDDLNKAQTRSQKGYIVEKSVEYLSNENLKYVGEHHKDFDWPKFGISVELKSGFSKSMYTKKGNLRKNYSVKFTNSNGTNNKSELLPQEVADILLFIANDGAFIIDRETIIKSAVKNGDGFSLKIPSDKITEVTRAKKITETNKIDYNFNLDKMIVEFIGKIKKSYNEENLNDLQ